MVFRLASLDLLTNEVIKRMINKFKQTEIPRLNKLYNYYLDKNAVLLRTQEDETKPNNKIAHPYAKYITDTFTGYFMGEPVAYLSDENIEPYKAILAYNDEEQENTNLARDCSIFGRAWEELYIDDDGQIRFTIIDPREVIAVYDEKIGDELLAIVRFYEKYNVVDDKTYLIVEVFNKDEVVTYQTGLGVDYLTEIDRKQLAFGFVPFVLYKNNKDDLGDYEEVLTLIDAYDSLVSDGINDFDYFCDAYLALYGYTADSEDIAQMKKNRVLLMDQGTNAEFLIKNGDSAGLETAKNRLEKDILSQGKSSGTLSFRYPGNDGGHAVHYNSFGDGTLEIQDGQCNKRFDKISDVYDNYGFDPDAKVGVHRLDKATPNFVAMSNDDAIHLDSNDELDHWYSPGFGSDHDGSYGTKYPHVYDATYEEIYNYTH